MKEKKVVTKRINESRVDLESGEILEKTGFERIMVDSEPSFVKLYFQDVALLHNLAPLVGSVLYELIIRMSYDNDIAIPSGTKKEICKRLEIFHRGTKEPAINSIDNCIIKLVKKGIMTKKDTGLYQINPAIFGKGSWREIRELRMKFTYNKEGRKVDTEIDSLEKED